METLRACVAYENAHQQRVQILRQLEMTEPSVETLLEDFGADVDHRDRDSRLDRPEASEFGVDARPEVDQAPDGEQSVLFADTAEDQQTLGGENAAA